MKNFEALDNIIGMDFSNMRALSCEVEGDHRASDEAIKCFVENFNQFFAQFKNDNPTQEELTTYECKMKQVLEKINEAEVLYYEDKYKNKGFSDAKQMAKGNTIERNKLPDRMQFWASNGKVGGSIRNLIEHKQCVENLAKWERLMNQKQQKQPSNQLSPSLSPNDNHRGGVRTATMRRIGKINYGKEEGAEVDSNSNRKRKASWPSPQIYTQENKRPKVVLQQLPDHQFFS
ncbi:hypothetical protein L3V79_03245 [Thiotrichales bacterium 19S9-12]|nr:hypothetical protein [Thiotrichales bacterium 19S9-11]MCF6811376.1 hypothetical protein [Thiotrichales bacterium 19S9-12]